MESQCIELERDLVVSKFSQNVVFVNNKQTVIGLERWT